MRMKVSFQWLLEELTKVLIKVFIFEEMAKEMGMKIGNSQNI